MDRGEGQECVQRTIAPVTWTDPCVSEIAGQFRPMGSISTSVNVIRCSHGLPIRRKDPGTFSEDTTGNKMMRDGLLATIFGVGIVCLSISTASADDSLAAAKAEGCLLYTSPSPRD